MFLYFAEIEHSCSNIKKFLIFEETETLKTSYISGGTFSSSKNFTLRKFIILQETEAPKKFIIFSQKKAVLIFWETETPPKIPYISGNGLLKEPTLKKSL